jgi:signal peptidase I
MSKRKIEVQKYLFLILIIYFIVSLFRYLIYDVNKVTSSSMFPTLDINDKIVVNKVIYGSRFLCLNCLMRNQISYNRLFISHQIRRNDVIVFNVPIYNGKQMLFGEKYVKRCIGLPKDTIFIDKIVSTRMKLIVQQKKSEGVLQTQFRYEGTDIYIPSIGDTIKLGKKETFLYAKIISSENPKVIFRNDSLFINDTIYKRHIFKKNYLFVIGDNYDSSTDSRSFGLVPYSHVIGKVEGVFNSLQSAFKNKCVLRNLNNLPEEIYKVTIK